MIFREGRDALFSRLSRPNACRILLALVALVSCLVVYVPFWAGDASIPVRYWDGPNYLYVAKTLYDIPPDHPLLAYENPPAYIYVCPLPHNVVTEESWRKLLEVM